MTNLLEKMDLLIDAINGLVVSNSAIANAQAAGCGCPGGSEPPSGPGEEGEPPPDGWVDPPGLGPGTEDYQNRKCSVSNLIWRWVLDVVTEMKLKGVDDILATGASGLFAVIVTYITEILSTLVLGGWVVLTIGFVAGITYVLLNNAVSLDNLKLILEDYEEDFICALYASTSTDQARTDFIQVAIDNGALIGQQLFLQAMLYGNDILNSLFFDPTASRAEQLEAILDGYVAPFDCTCGICVIAWDFASSVQNWTFFDDSDGGVGASAVGGYGSANQALEVLHILPDTESISSVNEMKSEVLPTGLTVTDGDLFTVTMGATSDANESQVTVQAHYTDATSDAAGFLWTVQDTFQLQLTAGKELEQLEVTTARSTGPGANGSTHYARVLDAQLTLSNPTNCPSNYPLP